MRKNPFESEWKLVFFNTLQQQNNLNGVDESIQVNHNANFREKLVELLFKKNILIFSNNFNDSMQFPQSRVDLLVKCVILICDSRLTESLSVIISTTMPTIQFDKNLTTSKYVFFFLFWKNVQTVNGTGFDFRHRFQATVWHIDFF